VGEHRHDEGESAARREAVSARRVSPASVVREGAGLLGGVLIAIGVSAGGAPVLAQGSDATPWSVTVKPTVNPLPIGSCGAVWLTLLDAAGRDRPRGPTGQYVTIADFDMRVTSANPNAVVGKYNGASIWSVCACQGAKVKDSATVTATYPAASLPAKARAPGVSFSRTANFTIKRRTGTWEPEGCSELKAANAAKSAKAKGGN
jgi:hypothetical protein